VDSTCGANAGGADIKEKENNEVGGGEHRQRGPTVCKAGRIRVVRNTQLFGKRRRRGGGGTKVASELLLKKGWSTNPKR